MKKIYKIGAVIVVLLFTTGCKKFLDVNSNPASPQVVAAEYLLPPIEYQMTNGTSSDYNQIWKITQNMGGSSTLVSALTWEIHSCPYNSGAPSDVSGVVWRMTYADLGQNVENMIKDAVLNQKYEYAAIGYAIKAWAFQMCTDEYGSIILNDAFNTDLLTFSYQDQSLVYPKVREWAYLSLKYAGMKSPSAQYATQLKSTVGDGIYAGDMSKWKKFVYGLLALQYGHLVTKAEYKTQYADSVTKFVDLSFANETESATVGFNASTITDSNPLGPTKNLFGTSGTYGYPTTTILNYLTGGVRGTAIPSSKTSVDPRLNKMLPPTTSTTPATVVGNYVAITPAHGSTTVTGVPFVWGPKPAGATVSPGKYIFTDKARYPLMTYSQLQFAKAEALFIKLDAPNAYIAYKNGIAGSMDFYNQYGRTSSTPDPVITTTGTVNDLSTYMASTEVAQSPATLTLADIMGQKYIAQWGWAGLETWCDLRKYHYSPIIFRTYYQLTTELPAINGGKYAYRLRPRYNSEYVWNGVELGKVGGLDANYMTQETWFSLP